MADYKGNTCPVCKQKFKEADDIVVCPDCGKEFSIFGDSKVDEVATEFDLKVLGRIPFDKNIAKACDEGNVESLDADFLDSAKEAIKRLAK